ncbi:MAG: helix-turn-helix domain-containing protein, partial [Nitrospinota bacterium]
ASVAVDVRVLAATNRDLAHEVEKGNFREDLFYRLNVVNIKLLPLEERRGDIVPLCHHYLKKFNFMFEKNVRISEKIMELFIKYPWKGNVRELVNVLESAVVQVPENYITLDCLPPSFREFATSNAGGPTVQAEGETLEQVEKEHIARVLKMVKGNKVQAAKVLGLGRSSLYRKLEKYSLEEYL